MGMQHKRNIELLIKEELEKIKSESYKAVKLSKNSQEIINTSVFQKLIAIFKALDKDNNGVISPLDLEKALAGKLGKIFRPLAMHISRHKKTIDFRTFEACFRDFLRVISNHPATYLRRTKAII